jgi:hypothetical protein
VCGEEIVNSGTKKLAVDEEVKGNMLFGASKAVDEF